jgi:hypothetical protein
MAFCRNCLMALERWLTKVSSLNVMGSPCRRIEDEEHGKQ